MATPKDYANALEQRAIVSAKIHRLAARKDITNDDPLGLKKATEMRALLEERGRLSIQIAGLAAELMDDPQFNRLHKPDDE